MTLAFCLVLALGVCNANAGPSQFHFDPFDNAYVEVASLGSIFNAQWAVIVILDLYGNPPDFGFGFSFYHTTYHDLCIHIVENGTWNSSSWEGKWAGSGSTFVLATSDLYMDQHPLTTTPQATATSYSADPTNQ